HLIYMTQFPSLPKKARKLSRAWGTPAAQAAFGAAAKCYLRGKRLAELRRYRQKGLAVVSGAVKRLFS
ncbi:MAG: hypothetical protein FWH06_01210, partial [Oscillospiraceae bacterium]|nr:hypothetical protein [Oscillospiraceae bacterium]